VANWDSRAIDFYVSNGKPPADAACRFTPHASWRVDAADTADWQPDQSFGQYQAVNLVAGAEGELFLVGFGTGAFDADRVDLFSLDFTRPPARLLCKVASRRLPLGDGNHFRYSGGLSLLSDGPAILSSPRNLGETTRLAIVRK
jgi:hypothetical protein